METDVTVLTSYHTKQVIWILEDTFVYLLYFEKCEKHRLSEWKKNCKCIMGQWGISPFIPNKNSLFILGKYLGIWMQGQMHMNHWTRSFFCSTLVSFMRKPWVTRRRINILRAMAERLGMKLMEQKAKPTFNPLKEAGRGVVVEGTVDESGGEEEMQWKDCQTDLQCYCISQDLVTYLKCISSKKKNKKL